MWWPRSHSLRKTRSNWPGFLDLPAGQKLELTDSAPFAELADMDLEAAKITAYKHRKDYLSVLEQIALTQRELKAVKYQRLPTLAFNGYYGVIGITTGRIMGISQRRVR